MRNIEYKEWDATEPIVSYKCVIAHVVNDIGAWGKGFVLALEREWPSSQEHYKLWMESKPPMGDVSYYELTREAHLFHLLAQKGLRTKVNPVPIDYEALRQALDKMHGLLGGLHNTFTIQMPRIGCGLAGGDWAVVEQIIIDELSSKGQRVIVCDMPKKIQPPSQ